jgi:hypothetical protein
MEVAVLRSDRKCRQPRAGKDALSIVNAMDHMRLHILTYNIHKGFSQFHQHLNNPSYFEGGLGD